MGSSYAKDMCKPSEKVVESLKNKVKLLQGDINEMMSIRESEYQSYERESIFFELKQAEWKRERRRLKAELKRLRMACEEKEEMRLKCMGDERENGWQMGRDETVEKWKQLYLAVKIELDDLIQRTHTEERMDWKTEENDILMELKRELRSKEEKIEILQAKLMSVEDQESMRERDPSRTRLKIRLDGSKPAPLPSLIKTELENYEPREESDHLGQRPIKKFRHMKPRAILFTKSN